MDNLNSIVLLGFVADLPRFFVDGFGRKFLRFSLAVERRDPFLAAKVCDFFAICVADDLVDLASAKIHQGIKILVGGCLANVTYLKGGGKSFKTEIIVDKFWLLEFG